MTPLFKAVVSPQRLGAVLDYMADRGLPLGSKSPGVLKAKVTTMGRRLRAEGAAVIVARTDGRLARVRIRRVQRLWRCLRLGRTFANLQKPRPKRLENLKTPMEDPRPPPRNEPIPIEATDIEFGSCLTFHPGRRTPAERLPSVSTVFGGGGA